MQRILLLLSLLSLAFRSSSAEFLVIDSTGRPVPDAVISAAGPTTNTPGEAIVDQVNKQFTPYVSVVPAGTAVRFPNGDQVRHHVYSFSEAKPFELKLYKGEPQEPVVFDSSGVVVLGCNIHDNMVGYLYVTERGTNALSDANGRAVLPGAMPSEIFVWHPALSLDGQAELTLDASELDRAAAAMTVRLPVAVPAGNPQAVDPADNTRFERFR